MTNQSFPSRFGGKGGCGSITEMMLTGPAKLVSLQGNFVAEPRERIMNKEIADKLVAALRSGKYVQTDSKLRDDSNGRCCLGVLCELAIEEGIAPDWDAPGVVSRNYYTVLGEGSVLPGAVREWAGMATNNGTYSRSDEGHVSLVACQYDGNAALSTDNDNGKPFKEIATFIEEYYGIL